jgi:hypothetical protein
MRMDLLPRIAGVRPSHRRNARSTRGSRRFGNIDMPSCAARHFVETAIVLEAPSLGVVNCCARSTQSIP